jgi:hypothetical protein
MDWLRLAGPLGWLLRPFAQHKPRLLRPQENVYAAGRGYLLPLLSTQSYDEGIALATSEDRVVDVSSGQITVEVDWSDIESYEIGDVPIPYYDESKYAVQLNTGQRTGRCLLAVRPQDKQSWRVELREHAIPKR